LFKDQINTFYKTFIEAEPTDIH